jgi:hypothetical protein
MDIWVNYIKGWKGRDLVPADDMLIGCCKRDRHMGDVVEVIVIGTNFRENTGSGPLDDQVIEFPDLTLYVKLVVLCVL